MLCDACYAALPWLGSARCEQCALPLHKSGICGACIAKPPRYDSVVAVFRYAWPLVPLIHFAYSIGSMTVTVPTISVCLVPQYWLQKR